MSTPTYIAQVIPAPQGWSAHGNPVPGEEFWYAADDGSAEIWPHEDYGWAYSLHGLTPTRVRTPEQGFALHTSGAADMVRHLLWWCYGVEDARHDPVTCDLCKLP